MRERSRSTPRLLRLNVLCLDHAPFRVLFLPRYSLFGQANDHNLRVVKCPQQFRQVTGLPTHGHTETSSSSISPTGVTLAPQRQPLGSPRPPESSLLAWPAASPLSVASRPEPDR